MLLETLNNLVDLIDCVEGIHELKPLSRVVQLMFNYSRPKELFQIEVVGEKKRFIIYRPTKLLEPEKDCKEIAYICDLVYIP